jgi:hypothetical protein
MHYYICMEKYMSCKTSHDIKNKKLKYLFYKNKRRIMVFMYLKTLNILLFYVNCTKII